MMDAAGRPPGFATRAIHAGQPPDPATGAVVPPLHLASTYQQERPGEHHGYEYSRTGNPTRAALETCLASLEEGSWGLAFASGMAASTAVSYLLQPGDRVLLSDDAYGGTYRLFARVLERYGIEHRVADLTDPSALERSLPGCRLVWVETPTNPLLKIIDLALVADRAHRQGALVLADNTFATPYLQRPLAHGCDLVLHSTTKYLGGHSDVVGGAIIGNEEEPRQRLQFYQNATGGVPSPFDCWLVLRGIRTLPVRMDAHVRAARAVAEFLAGDPRVARVHYPGLPTHPQHALAARQMSGFGGMVSFEVHGGEAAAREVVSSTKVFILAESLGGVESLIEHPASMTHASVQNSPLAVPPALVRLSVGLETTADLVHDLAQALDRIG